MPIPEYMILPQNKTIKKYLLHSLLLIALHANGQQYAIKDSVYIFTTNQYCVEAISSTKFHTFPFLKASGSRVDFGFVGNQCSIIILKLTANQTILNQYLCIDNTSLDTISISHIKSNGEKELLYLGGSLVAFNNNQNYIWHTVPVEISKIPSWYVITMKAAQKNINVRYEIISEPKLQRKYRDYEKIIFFYAGVITLITIVVFLAFILFKQVIFGAYLGYIICFSTWVLSHYGRLFPLLYSQFPLLNTIAKPVSSLGAGLFLLTVLQYLFQSQLELYPMVQNIVNWSLRFLYLCITCMFLFLIINLPLWLTTTLIIVWHTGLIISIAEIVLLPFLFFNYGITAKIFSLATLVVCIMAIVQLVANAGYIDNFFINEHGMTMGSLLEISIMAFGLFYRLVRQTKYKEMKVLALEQEQTEILKKLITVQDHERKRIAGDLHDNIGPLLAALKINFRRIIYSKDTETSDGLAAKTESIIDDAIAEIRNVAHNLMPKGLSTNGLINTLTEYFSSIQQLYAKKIIFNHQVESILDPELQINLYRIICELVLNAAKHSDASTITISLRVDNNRISFGVLDDGQGFKIRHNQQDKALGLQSAESRILYLKGKFKLRSEPGQGTAIEMEIPLQFYKPEVNGF